MRRNLLPKVLLPARTFASLNAKPNYKFPSYLLNAPATQLTKLDSGLQVASEAIYGETVSVGLWVNAGSRVETIKNNGAAHFLEHISFKGTNRRTKEQFEEQIENKGSHVNAFTSRELTVYYARVLKDDLEFAVELLSDMILNSRLDNRDIENERGVILRESVEVAASMVEVIHDKLHEATFSKCGLGLTILGSEGNINSLKRSDLKDFIDTHYIAPRSIICAAGAVDHEHLCDLTSQYFKEMRTVPKYPPPKDEGLYTPSEIRTVVPGQHEAHIAIAFEGGSWNSKWSLPIMIMQTVLGTWERTEGSGRSQSSYLCSEIAKHELAHKVSSFNTFYNDTGLFGITAVCGGEKDRQKALMSQLLSRLSRFEESLTEEMVEKAKTQLKLTWLMDVDGTSSTIEDIGRQMLTYGRRVSPAEMFMRTSDVTLEQVKECIRTVVRPEKLSLASVGPVEDLPDLNWMRAQM